MQLEQNDGAPHQPSAAKPTRRQTMRTALLGDLDALKDIFWDRVAGMDPAR